MIDAKQAVQVAKEKAAEMLNQFPINLEELERDSYQGRDVWSVTLSFPPQQNTLRFDPQYKRFTIDAETGEFLAMKIREVASR